MVKYNHAIGEINRLKAQLARARITPVPALPYPAPPNFPPERSVLNPEGRSYYGIGRAPPPDFDEGSFSDITQTVGGLKVGGGRGSIDSSTDTAGTGTSRLDPAAVSFTPTASPRKQ
jgi:hypothetical protein